MTPHQASSPLHTLHELTQHLGEASEQELEMMLAHANALLHTEIGIISRIHGEVYHVFAVDAEGADLEGGEEFDLGSTYCSMTLAADDVVAIAHMAISEHARHPCYEAFGLETYIGAPLVVNGALFGTLNFSASTPRETPWDERDVLVMRLLAKMVCAALERRAIEQRLRDALDEQERLTEELTRFAALISHNMRTPLRNMRQLSEWIVEDEQERLSEEGRHNLMLLRERGQLGEQLVDELSAYARAGLREETRCAILAHEVVRETFLLAGHDDITLDLTTDTHRRVVVEKAALKTALMHLLNWAGEDAEERVEVYVMHHHDAPARLRVDIIYTGAPLEHISGEVSDHLIEVPSVSRRPRTGMALAARCAATHQGSVQIVHADATKTHLRLEWPIAPSR